MKYSLLQIFKTQTTKMYPDSTDLSIFLQTGLSAIFKEIYFTGFIGLQILYAIFYKVWFIGVDWFNLNNQYIPVKNQLKGMRFPIDDRTLDSIANVVYDAVEAYEHLNEV